VGSYHKTYARLFHHVLDSRIEKSTKILLPYRLKLEGYQVTSLLLKYAVVWMKEMQGTKAIDAIGVGIANN